MNESNAAKIQKGVLAALGFGPNSPLMKEPRLFTDRHFLATLLLELERELDPTTARTALFQIGLIRGVCDAYRVLDQAFLPHLAPLASPPGSLPLAIRLESQQTRAGIEIPGSWPQGYEARARLSKLDASPLANCSLSAGYTSGWLSGILDANVLAVEHRCVARGDSNCEFLALESEAWRTRGHAEACELLAAISFGAAREAALAARQGAAVEDAAAASGPPLDSPPLHRCEVAASRGPESFDPNDSAVHVWGPVMVLPCADLDQALHTIDMLGYEASVSAVRAVVLDLRNTILDPGLGANTLEQIVEYVEAWGAEAILTNVAPLSEETVSSLEVAHLLVRKDLPEAIAAAFQISEAQKHFL